MILGRIILATDGETFSLVRKKWLTKIFVCGDVLSFFVLAGGVFLVFLSSSFRLPVFR
jgi:hypothetical protein